MESQDELFRSIYVCYLPLIRTIARRFFIPQDDIDDVVQDVFAAFYRVYQLNKPDEENRKLLARIGNNCCLNYKRKQKLHPEFSCDPLVIQEEMMVDSFISHDSLSILLKKQEYERIATVLSSMKPEWADVFRLCVIEGRPMAEVAKILGVTEPACRMRLHRGRKYLQTATQNLREADEKEMRERKRPEAMSLREA